MLLSKNDDYAYIQTFIDFLKQIIEMITKLFSGMGGTAAPEEDKKEENAGETD